MDFNKPDYDMIFRNAKSSTVHAHAIVWVKEIMEDKKTTDREKFIEIQRIVNDAIKNLKD